MRLRTARVLPALVGVVAALAASTPAAHAPACGNGGGGADLTAAPPACPAPFFFGTATAAYQVEGAVHAGGRGPSIWDAFSHTPGRVARGDTGDVADDFYHRFAADLTTAAALGATAFRFSLAWPRLFPNGTGEEVNAAGIAFYDRVLDACEAAGLEPYVTLFHWDLPLALQEE